MLDRHVQIHAPVCTSGANSRRCFLLRHGRVLGRGAFDQALIEAFGGHANPRGGPIVELGGTTRGGVV